MLKKLLLITLGLFASPAGATTYFSIPNTFVDGPAWCAAGCAANMMGNFNNLVANGNAGYTSLLASITALGGSGPPAGMVAYFNSSYTTCPTGWSTADGSSNPLDMRGVFARGLDTGGLHGPVTALGTYYADTLQNHTHSITTYTTGGISYAGGAGSSFNTVTSYVNTSVSATGLASSGNVGNETRPYGYLFTACVSTGLGSGATSYTFANPPQTIQNGNSAYATQVMANFNQIVGDGNTAYNAIGTAVSGLTAGAVPSGAVAPFNLSSCPAGWVASNGGGGTVDLRGYFLRVWNNTGTGIDPSRVRNSVQAMALQAHVHSTSSYMNSASSGNENSTGATGYVAYASPSSGTGGVINCVGSGGCAGTETRPKFVALLMCQKS